MPINEIATEELKVKQQQQKKAGGDDHGPFQIRARAFK